MISLGIEYDPPPTKKEIRAWRKWKKELSKMEAAFLKQEAAPDKKEKRKNIKKKGSKK